MSLLDDVGDVYAGLGELAAPAVLSHTTRGVHNSATGTPGVNTITTCNTLAVLDATSMRGLGFKYGEGLVQGGDIDALVPGKGLTFTPQPGDLITVAGTQYTIVTVRPTYAGAVAVTHSLLVRK